MPTAPLVARKTITTIQQGSVYKERFILGASQPEGTTARIEFFDSAGGSLADLEGEVDGYTVTFTIPYADVDVVPNGAGFYCYIQGLDDGDDEHMVRYGTVFRRELTFPNSPATATSTVVRQFEDSFQRPAGAVGGRWKVLLGRPQIFDNVDWFGFGEDHPNTVGVNFAFFTSYFMRYYQPFNGDTVELSISATKKGLGLTVVALSMNSDGSSYLYAGFRAGDNTVELGFGTSADLGSLIIPSGALEPQTEPVPLTVPGSSGMGTYKITFDDVTKELAFWNADKTTKHCSWVDDGDLVPHGKGYRYFGIGGSAGLINSGVQLAHVKAQGMV